MRIIMIIVSHINNAQVKDPVLVINDDVIKERIKIKDVESMILKCRDSVTSLTEINRKESKTYNKNLKYHPKFKRK